MGTLQYGYPQPSRSAIPVVVEPATGASLKINRNENIGRNLNIDGNYDRNDDRFDKQSMRRESDDEQDEFDFNRYSNQQPPVQNEESAALEKATTDQNQSSNSVPSPHRHRHKKQRTKNAEDVERQRTHDEQGWNVGNRSTFGIHIPYLLLFQHQIR